VALRCFCFSCGGVRLARPFHDLLGFLRDFCRIRREQRIVKLVLRQRDLMKLAERMARQHHVLLEEMVGWMLMFRRVICWPAAFISPAALFHSLPLLVGRRRRVVRSFAVTAMQGNTAVGAKRCKSPCVRRRGHRRRHLRAVANCIGEHRRDGRR
jgi:hypothetical protein